MKTYRILAVPVLAGLLFAAGCGDGAKAVDIPTQAPPPGVSPNDMGGHGAGGGATTGGTGTAAPVTPGQGASPGG